MIIDLLKKVIEGLKIIKSVEEINLSHNDLDDTFIHVILEFILTPGLKRINLNHNKFSKVIMKLLSNAIKNAKN